MNHPSRTPPPERAASRPLRSRAAQALAVGTGLALAGWAVLGQQTGFGQAAPVTAKAKLVDAKGVERGTVTLTETAAGLRLVLRATGLSGGPRGVHVHANGECAKGPDAQTGEVIPFGKAGGHFDPNATRNHGNPSDSPKVAHAGDIPNLGVAGGTGTLDYTTRDMTLREGPASIAGRSVVVHENADDYATDPAGATGGRELCGVVVLEPSRQDSRYAIPGANTFPEGIALDRARGVFYTGSSSDGTIYAVDLGTRQPKVVSLGGSPGRASALGMKLDGRGRLLVAGGAQGTVAAVDPVTGATLQVLETPKAPQTFINDLVVAPDGWAYVTDSARPVVFRFRTDAARLGPMQAWLDLRGSPVRYRDGVNLNGIVVSRDGRNLLSVQTNTGRLYRIDIAGGAVREVDLGGQRLEGGDGLVLAGDTLHVIRNAQGRIDRVRLSPSLRTGLVGGGIADPNFRFPTTAVLDGGRLLVVNAQLDKQRQGAPVLPFTVTGMQP